MKLTPHQLRPGQRVRLAIKRLRKPLDQWYVAEPPKRIQGPRQQRVIPVDPPHTVTLIGWVEGEVTWAVTFKHGAGTDPSSQDAYLYGDIFPSDAEFEAL